MSSISESALELAKLGFYTFPLHSIVNGACTCGFTNCKSQGKHPRKNGWQKNATNDPKIIDQLFNDNDNIGVPTGKQSNLFVMDIDPKNGGDQSFAKLKNLFGAIEEDTLIADTGGGGFHLYYQYEGRPIKSYNGTVLGPGIDIKAEGGYVVSAPSIHISGRRYAWRNGLYVPSRLPEDLEEVIKSNGKENHTTADLKERDSIPEGERNNTLTRFAGRYRAQGNSFDELNARLLKVNQSQCNPPIDQREVENIARSICRYEKGFSYASFRDYWIRCMYNSITHGLDHGTKGILVALSQLMDENGSNCIAPQSLIAAKANCSVPTVSKQIKKAVALGWLKQWHLPKTNGDKGIYCRYQATIPKHND